MKFFCLLFILLLLVPAFAQESANLQPGHTHDILEVKFSPDDRQLVSYSAADGRLCLWEVETGRLLWMSKTTFIRQAKESINLKEFDWSADGKSLVTRSVNGTFQTWDLQTGKILAVGLTKPTIKLISPDKKTNSITKIDDEIRAVDDETGEVKTFERFGNNSAFNISNGGTMFVEGGGWGDDSIKITNIKTGKSWRLDGHLAQDNRIYLGFTFQKDNPDDEDSDDYGTEQKLYLGEADLPKQYVLQKIKSAKAYRIKIKYL